MNALNEIQMVWRLNIPESLGLVEAGLDDLGVDGEGNIHISDGVNGAVYRFRSSGETDRTFDVIRPGPLNGRESGLSLAVVADSSFYVADPGGERVVRYDSLGQTLGEFTALGLLSLCWSRSDHVYALASDDDGERVDCYDSIGSRIEGLCAPRRRRARLDPELVSIDVDADGRAYFTYGMPPYRIWRVSECGGSTPLLPGAEGGVGPPHSEDDCSSELETWCRDLDHPEDALLISDLALDAAGSLLWVLLASREAGRQMLDLFAIDGRFLGSSALPHSENLYSSICAADDGALYLLDDAGGNLVRMHAPLP